MKQDNSSIEELRKNKAVLIRWRTAFFVTAAAWGVTFAATLLYACFR